MKLIDYREHALLRHSDVEIYIDCIIECFHYYFRCSICVLSVFSGYAYSSISDSHTWASLHTPLSTTRRKFIFLLMERTWVSLRVFYSANR